MSLVIELLSSVLGNYKTYNNNWYYFECTFCHHKNKHFCVNTEKNFWKCWHCNKSGTLPFLFHKLKCSKEEIKKLYDALGNIPKRYSENITNNIELSLPEEFISLNISSNSIAYKHAILYLEKRNIHEYDVIRYNIGYCADGRYKNRIIIPSYDKNGFLNYFMARAFDHNKFRYLNPPISKNIIGFESHINWSYPIILCEGAFDAIAVRRNAIPLFGKTIPQKLYQEILIHDIPHIYLLLDYDAKEWAIAAAEKLMCNGKTVTIVSVPEGKDASDLGFDWTQIKIRQTNPFSSSDLLKYKVQLI
jgi:DNA primase